MEWLDKLTNILGGGVSKFAESPNMQAAAAMLGQQMDPYGAGGVIGRPAQTLIQMQAQQRAASERKTQEKKFSDTLLRLLGGGTGDIMPTKTGAGGLTGVNISGDKYSVTGDMPGVGTEGLSIAPITEPSQAVRDMPEMSGGKTSPDISEFLSLFLTPSGISGSALEGMSPEQAADAMKTSIAMGELKNQTIGSIMGAMGMPSAIAGREAQSELAKAQTYGLRHPEISFYYNAALEQVKRAKTSEEIEKIKSETFKNTQAGNLGKAQADLIINSADEKRQLLRSQADYHEAEADLARKQTGEYIPITRSEEEGQIKMKDLISSLGGAGISDEKKQLLKSQAGYYEAEADLIKKQVGEYIPITHGEEDGQIRMRDFISSLGDGGISDETKFGALERERALDLENKILAADEKIATSKGAREASGNVEFYNKNSTKPYVWAWTDIPYATDAYTKIRLPFVGGEQLTARQVYRSARKRGMSIEDYLEFRGIK